MVQQVALHCLAGFYALPVSAVSFILPKNISVGDLATQIAVYVKSCQILRCSQLVM